MSWDQAVVTASGMLPRDGGNEIYWETSGNPEGVPVLHLHGGPGSGLGAGYRSRQDAATHFVIGLDQRGCGRSRPLATDPSTDLGSNTTHALIGDLEALRDHLGVERWLVVGGSWGTTLALAYAQEHPDRVIGLVLAAVTSTSTPEVDWLTGGIRRVFPEAGDAFEAAVEPRPGERVVDAYARVLASGEPAEKAAAALAWCRWEDAHVSLLDPGATSERYGDPEFRLLFATLVTHYFAHSGFGGDEILGRMSRLRGIPGVLIHGRADISSPLETAWRLNLAWPESELRIVEAEGHGGSRMTELLEEGIARLTASRV